MAVDRGGDLYNQRLVDFLEHLWGSGWLSPGGPAEVARLLDAIDVAGLAVLDVGCGAGGAALELVRTHGAGYVTGVDVEQGVLARARQHVADAGLGDRIGLALIAPGPLPFPPGTFDLVFSKDAIVHIRDKGAIMREAFRVLRPGGWLAASDWLIGHDGPPTPAMAAYIAAEGLDFGMASPARYAQALAGAGFSDIALFSRNAWYRDLAREELALLQGPLGAKAAASVGEDFVASNVAIWTLMLPVLEFGRASPDPFPRPQAAHPRLTISPTASNAREQPCGADAGGAQRFLARAGPRHRGGRSSCSSYAAD